MGSDSVQPFLEYEGKWVIILGLTSNKGSEDFQLLPLQGSDQELFERVIERCSKYGSTDQIMFVVGATQTEYIKRIRRIVPDHFFLVPGVGAQGGSLEEVCEYGLNDKVGLLVNSSRAIIYADDSIHFAEHARTAALSLQEKMSKYI